MMGSGSGKGKKSREKERKDSISSAGSSEVAPTCNPSTLGGQGRPITCVQEFKTSLINMVKPRFY